MFIKKVINFNEKNENHMIEANRLIDEEASKLENSSTSNNDSMICEKYEDQQHKKDLFKSYLFSSAQDISTPDLFSKIVNLIQESNLEDIKIRNIKEEDELEEKINIDKVGIKEENINELDMEKEPEFIIDDKGNKKYKHLYRGVIQLLDHPPKKTLKQNYDSDNSYYSD
jgi:hypothetical protein